MAFTVGADCINRALSLGNAIQNIRWLIELSNPAPENGTIVEVCAYITEAAAGYTGYLGTFYETDGGIFSSRDCVEVAFPSSPGLKTWTGLSLNIQAGDYIAIGHPIAPDGTFGVDLDSGGVGVRHGAFAGVTCPVTDETFGIYSNYVLSLKGTSGIVVSLPTVTTNPATSVEATKATPNGTLDNDGGEACACGFEWGETIAYGNTTPTQSRTTGQTFAQIITGLDPNKTYHFRAFATNSAGTSYGADRSFATPLGIPTVTTDPATGLGAVLATLNGTLDDDGGEASECGFEWGLDTGYGVTTPTQSKITGETFSQVIHGLFPGTIYHFRAFATNSVGTAYGSDETFTTALVVSRAYALAREEL